jgi:hypothetical protein
VSPRRAFVHASCTTVADAKDGLKCSRVGPERGTAIEIAAELVQAPKRTWSAAAVGTAMANRKYWTPFDMWYAAQCLSASWAYAID